MRHSCINECWLRLQTKKGAGGSLQLPIGFSPCRRVLIKGPLLRDQQAWLISREALAADTFKPDPPTPLSSILGEKTHVRPLLAVGVSSVMLSAIAAPH